MPVHDRTRVDAGLFRDFHQRRIGALRDRSNMGNLPPDYYALIERSNRGPIPDALASRLSPSNGEPSGANPTLAVRPSTFDGSRGIGFPKLKRSGS
jgi:hypothetical protein